MIEVAEVALVDKAVVREHREKTEKELKSGDPLIMAEAIGAKRTMEKFGLWEEAGN